MIIISVKNVKNDINKQKNVINISNSKLNGRILFELNEKIFSSSK